jgi:Tol biopolymer transport system component
LTKTFDPTYLPRPLTHLNAIAYEPVWSPDGSLIAFVTETDGSDDVWVVGPDGAVPQPLVRNEWEWDKHPSWSPDSTRIAFMSNRSGVQAIWVMERTGQNPRNISNVSWPEYDPVWVK